MFLWANAKKDFESIEPNLRKDLIDSIQIWIFGLEIQAFYWERIQKSTHGQRGLAKNVVPSLLSFIHNSMISHVFVVINPYLDLVFH